MRTAPGDDDGRKTRSVGPVCLLLRTQLPRQARKYDNGSRRTFGPKDTVPFGVHDRAVRWVPLPRLHGPEEDPVAIKVFLLDDHEVVRVGELRQLLEEESDIEVVGEADGFAGACTGARPAPRCRRPRRPTARRRRRHGLPRHPFGDGPTAGVPDAHVVLRRRGVVRRDHGRRCRLPPQAGERQRPRGRRPTVATGGSMVDPAPPPRCSNACGADAEQEDPRFAGAHRPGTPHPRTDRRRDDQPADRDRDVPRREDGQELRLSMLHKLGMERRTEAAVFASERRRSPH